MRKKHEVNVFVEQTNAVIRSNKSVYNCLVSLVCSYCKRWSNEVKMKTVISAL